MNNSPNHTSGEENKPAQAGKNGWKKAILFFAVVLTLCACGWQYWYNTPEQQIRRIMEEAETVIAGEDYAGAAQLYTDVLMIDGTNEAAWEGMLTSVAKQADLLSLSEDRAGQVQACALYEEAIALYEEAEESGVTVIPAAYREEAAGKLEELRAQIAAGYGTVECTTIREDRSGTQVLPDGTQIPYIWYYDLVRITDEEYPYADRINSFLEQEMQAFFSGNAGDPSAAIRKSGAAEGGEYKDYVGEAGIYAQDGLISIRAAEVRVQGKEKSNYFRGHTFRLADAGETTLAELTGRTDSSVRRLVRRRIWGWLEQEGYRGITKADVEAYAEDTDADDFKFCILPDKGICLIVDQEAPFFSGAGEILEIPLE